MQWWYRGKPAAGQADRTYNVGLMKYWIAGQVDGWMPFVIHSITTGVASVALTGVSFTGAGSDSHAGTAILHLAGVSLTGVGTASHHATGLVSLAGVSIVARGFDAGVPGAGLRQIWTL